MTWTKFIKPTTVDRKYSDAQLREAVFTIAPLTKGYGVTLGNSLRRVLMSSITGSAITTLKIDGVNHEFSAINGIKEDVSDIILNLKACRVKLTSDSPKKARIIVKGPAVVQARNIEAVSNVEILDPDHVICTVDEGGIFNAELTIASGIGYVPSLSQKESNAPIGTISIDALFSPVVFVNFKVEPDRLGHCTNYDKLILTIRTDGSLLPEEALSQASKILKDHFGLFTIGEEITENKEESVAISKEEEFNKNLFIKTDDLELSVRSTNCLKNEGIFYVGDLIQLTEEDLMRTPNFGCKSLNEIKAILQAMGLSLGMTVPGWNKSRIEKGIIL